MKAGINRQWTLASRPAGMVKTSDFALRQIPIPALQAGECLVRVLFIAFEPAMRGWMTDRPGYVEPIQLGDVMRAAGVGQVLDSRHADLKPGDFVRGFFGWQEYAVAGGQGAPAATRISGDLPLTAHLSVLGTTGLTAYFGLLDVGRPQAGETVVVSGAAGAVGSIAGQLAKLHGCRAIGVAGGPQKCAWLTEEAGFDAAVDYKAERVPARLRELCPHGIHIFFDNVGGQVLEAGLALLAQRGRIVLCGGISRYNEEQPSPGPRNYLNLVIQRGRMEGFLVMDYAPRYAEALQALAGWVQQGKLKHKEDILEGFENAPRTFLRLFEGLNFGKQLLKIADPPLGPTHAG